jgi:LysM repeat protein
VDELRIELDDLKFALNTTQVELGLLNDRLKKQDNAFSSIKGQNQSQEAASLSLLSSLEKKVLQLEKTLDKAANDLRTLSQSVGQTLTKIQSLETHVSQHDQRLEEVTKLKGTLTSISKAIGQRPVPEAGAPATKNYHVKAGDSLEKIARANHITVDVLRKINNLSNDKILVGQELRLEP